MYRRLAAGVKRAFGLHRPGRDLEVFPDDVFIVSYPKSGNTWTRFLIANLIYPEKDPDFRNINELIPDPEALSKRHLAKLARPRIIKTHQYFHPCYRKMIFVIRDPRDVAVSLYHFQIKGRVYPDGHPIDEHVKAFVRNVSPLYGTWGENTASWLAARGNDPDFLLLRYEDMLKDPAQELRKIAEFMHIEAGPDRIGLAVDRSSAGNMRKLERSQAHLWSSTKETRQDIPFVRTASSGNWQSELSRTSVIEIERAWGRIMRHLGYALLCAEEAEIEGDEFLRKPRFHVLGESGTHDFAKVL
jgi:Sulfotransferase domain